MSNAKQFDQWLVIDWKTGESRTRKSKPSATNLSANELLAELKIGVEVPEVTVPTLGVEIDVPEPQVYQSNMDALSAEDLPDWTEAADAVVENHEQALLTALDDPEAWRNHIDTLTTRTLRDAPGRPPVEQVREYITDYAEYFVRGERDE